MIYVDKTICRNCLYLQQYPKIIESIIEMLEILEDEESGYDFAKMFVEAGFAVPNDVFVGIFRKVMEL